MSFWAASTSASIFICFRIVMQLSNFVTVRSITILQLRMIKRRAKKEYIRLVDFETRETFLGDTASLEALG